jgi:RHS repeat-associated protein
MRRCSRCDGSLLRVDDGLTTDTVDLDLAAGAHVVRLEYVGYAGGAAQLTWAQLTPVVLASGEWLGKNQTRVSLDGLYRLQYQGDGNLVVVRLADDSCAWSSQTNGTGVRVTVMQRDGNLVVYDADGVPVWNAGTAGYDGARLEIANDTMAIVGPDGMTRWSVSLAAEPVRPAMVAASRPCAAALLALVIALGGFAVMGLRRRLAGSATQRVRRAVAHLPATALLLTGVLLLPAGALAQIPTHQVEYYHTDALGSVRAVTKQVNGTWQVVARHDYMPASARPPSTASYGGPRRSARCLGRREGGPFGEEVAPPNPPQDKRLFTGKERDSETTLDYFGARYLSSGLGRFTTADPLLQTYRPANPQTLNRYAYTLSNPLRFIDRNGLYEEDVHRNLTEVLALAVGFDARTAAAIASADQGVDDNASTKATAGYEARRDYHFTTPERRAAMWAAFESSGTTADLGLYLHVEQDSFSHAGYGPRTGHAIALTGPDKTYNDSRRADRMASDTYDRLSAASDRLGASGSRLAWAKIDALVGDFNRATTPAEKNKILGQLRALVRESQGRQANQRKKDEEVAR